MKLLFSHLFLIISISGFSQDTKDIDQQIWIPFTKAWEANDGQAFNAIHTDDVWRITPGRLLVGNEYKDRNLDLMRGQVKSTIIEFYFEHRMVNGDNAYEVGYYRISDPDKDEPLHIGRFHVALKRINGTWKISQDWDTDKIDGESFDFQSLEQRSFIHFN